MNTKRIPSPQHAPAVALLELITEHPELRASWRLGDDGFFMGNRSVDSDGRAEMARFVAVFGGTPAEAVTDGDTGARWSSWLWTTWRDVELSLTVSCPADAVASAVPVALPSEWRAA